MDKFTRTIAMASARRPWRTLASWLLLMGVVFVLAGIGGGHFSDDFSAKGSQSDQAMQLLDEKFPQAEQANALVVFAVEDGTTLQEHRQDVTKVLADVAGVAHIETVADPFAAGTISDDGRIGYAQLTLDAPAVDLGKGSFAVLSQHLDAVGVPGLRLELGGDAVFLNAPDESSPAEGIGILVALLVLLVAFGTVVAAVVPIGLAITSVGAGIGGILVLASVMNVSPSAIPVAGVVGIGVGIDYALFIVARYRENRSAGQTNQTALSNAMASSGAAVVFAGGTVVVAMAALALTGLGVLTSIGLATALVVLTAVAAAVTLLPALLSLLGDRIDSGRLVRRHRPAKRLEASGWWRFAHRVSGRPWPYLLGAVVVLVGLALPAFWIQTGFPAAGDAPSHTTHRQAYDLLDQGFGPGVNGPMLVVVDLDTAGVSAAEVPALATEIGASSHIASVGGPVTSADGSTVIFSVVPTTGPADPETSVAISEVRDLLPDNVYVTGVTALTGDLNTQLGHTLPIFIGAVLGAAFLLLMLVFRSVVVPLKAAVMNLLSIGGAYGVLVAVFQWGWGSSLIGLEGPTPITSLIIVIMFPILFGLSMDYEVFLISRIREEFVRTGDNVESVARGLAGTGRVITSAALIMVVVFLAFVASPVPSLKMLGLGLAVAILIDATIVRMVLVPATMALLGKANWWLPTWLDRILPRVTMEGSVDDSSVSAVPEELVSS
ncbi:MMPL family transporter [Nocardioides sp.]|uniref:MMPL family transporter n=1 Tax=Nocardioides sp. TaxID=35761 RepID=UPI0031FEBF8F|nr:family transporter [Nocardioides sp.]